MSSLLHQEIEAKIQGRIEEGNYIDIPSSITENIKQSLRDYQNKAVHSFTVYLLNFL